MGCPWSYIAFNEKKSRARPRFVDSLTFWLRTFFLPRDDSLVSEEKPVLFEEQPSCLEGLRFSLELGYHDDS
jgi:hypothetical protein